TRRELGRISWPASTRLAASRLLGELIGSRERPDLDGDRRSHAETMLADVLQPVAMTNIDVRYPKEARVRQVAEALTEDPSDNRTLEDWGRQVGASARTLARAFRAETGLPFGRWRGLLRL